MLKILWLCFFFVETILYRLEVASLRYALYYIVGYAAFSLLLYHIKVTVGVQSSGVCVQY